MKPVPFLLLAIPSLVAALCSLLPSLAAATPPTSPTRDMLVVGAGISGLAAALEAARGGATVTVVEMSSVFGGHAVMSEGGLCLVGTPLQARNQIVDTPDLAYRDLVTWGEDADPGWARYYVDHCLPEVHDWLGVLGVEFEKLRWPPGNSVPRFHETKGRGLGLVGPIYRECLSQPGIDFVWNHEVTRLIRAEGHVVGAEAQDRRTGATRSFAAHAVILATGGFQSSPDFLRAHWPAGLGQPTRLLLGSGINSVGLGHRVAAQAGAVLIHPEYQWNYPYGLPDPRHPDSPRGLHARNTGALWVNASGRRFVNEIASPSFALPAVLRQPGLTYWAIFDERTKPFFWVAGTDWANFAAIQRWFFDDPAVIKTAPSLAALAELTALPAAALQATVARYNELVTAGDDVDFGRFGSSAVPFKNKIIPLLTRERRIEHPPYYAVQFFPLTRKSNGGVKVDLSCRVLDRDGHPLPGLFAVGELTGSGGMNGKAALEGVWLGPGVAMGRVAARAALREPRSTAPTPASTDPRPADAPPRFVADDKRCIDCHHLTEQLAQPRAGYWHFEKVHAAVLQRERACLDCHAELAPSATTPHRINRFAQLASCVSCHGTP